MELKLWFSAASFGEEPLSDGSRSLDPKISFYLPNKVPIFLNCLIRKLLDVAAELRNLWPHLVAYQHSAEKLRRQREMWNYERKIGKGHEITLIYRF